MLRRFREQKQKLVCRRGGTIKCYVAGLVRGGGCPGAGKGGGDCHSEGGVTAVAGSREGSKEQASYTWHRRAPVEGLA